MQYTDDINWVIGCLLNCFWCFVFDWIKFSFSACVIAFYVNFIINELCYVFDQEYLNDFDTYD